MRFAPADYVNDTAVKYALRRRDLAASTFYPLFLFHSFMEGGSLPSDLDLLSAVVGMDERDVKKAVDYWKKHGKIVEKDGRLENKRVAEQIAEERAFRSEQAESGRRGGATAGRGRALSKDRATPIGAIGPPSPTPSPTPSPVARQFQPHPLVPDTATRERFEREALQLVRTISDLTGEDGSVVMARGKSTPRDLVTGSLNPATWSHDRLLNTLADLRAILKHEKAKKGAA